MNVNSFCKILSLQRYKKMDPYFFGQPCFVVIHLFKNIQHTYMSSNFFENDPDIKLPQLKNIYGQGKITFE